MLRPLLVALATLLTAAAPAAAAPSWLPPSPLTATDSADPVVAVAPDGTTIAAWSRAEGGTTIVEAVRRRPGEAFGPPLELGGDGASSPQVGIDAGGNATVAWEEDGVGVRAARLPAAGTAFEPAATVADDAEAPVLAVGAGGTAVLLSRAVGGGLQGAVREAAAGAFAPPAPMSAGAAAEADVAVAPGGHAVAAWVEDGQVRVGERAPGAPFPPTGTARSDVPDGTVGEPAVAIDTAGRTVVAWTQDADGALLEPPEVWAVVGAGAPERASSGGAAARAPDLAAVPGGGVAGTWVRGAQVELADVAATATAFAGHAGLPSAPDESAAPAIAAGGDGAVHVAWAGAAAVHAARRPAGGAVASATLAAGSGAGDPALAADDEGNATAAWRTPGQRVAAAGFDAAAPVLTGVTVPATATAGAPAGPMTASAADRWGPVAFSWAFGDGTGATGGAVAHAFGTAGAFDVTVTATDAAGNASSAVRRIGVAAAPAPPPPPPPPPVARVAAEVAVKWRVRGRRIKLERMRLTALPAGTEAELRCRGRRCPIRRTRIFTPRRGVIDVVRPLDADQRRFRAGQRLELRVSAPGHVGQVLRFHLRRGERPEAVERCLPIGSTAVRKSC